jgi:sporulation protein YlmC with PRC-barrel domain
MAENRFESSRIAGGTLNRGAHEVAGSSQPVPEESSAISRDDVRDGVSETEKPGPGSTASAARNNRRVLAAGTLTGDPVRNPAGESLGKIEQIMIDLPTGRVAYAFLSFGGFLGIGDKFFAVPWSALQIDRGEHEFILDVDARALETAPGFNKDNWPDMADPAFARDIHAHYGQTPSWEQDFTDAGDYIGDNAQHNRSIDYEPTTSYRPVRK